MAYKRYFYRNGKKIGPYYYESYRDKTGKVKKRYVGTKNPDSPTVTPTIFNKKNAIYLSISLVVLLSVFLLIFLNNFNFTGKVILDAKDSYISGENLSGILNLNLKQGELIPADSKLLVSVGNKSKLVLLSDLIDSSLSSGNFYAEGFSLGGNGSGFGFEGEKEVEISFELGIIQSENQTGGGGSGDEVTNETPESVINESSSNEQINNTEEEPTQNDSQSVSEQPSENTEPPANEQTEVPTEPTPETPQETSPETSPVTNAESSTTETPSGNNDNSKEKKDKESSNADSNSKEKKDKTDSNSDSASTGSASSSDSSPASSSSSTDSSSSSSESSSKKSEKSSSPSSSSGESSSSSSSSSGDSGSSSSSSSDSGSSSSSSDSSSGGITGNVIAEEKNIFGVVSKSNPFEYELYENEEAEIIKGSVTINNGQVNESLIKVKVQNKKAVVTTDYVEKGFGEEFILNNEETIKINLDRLGFAVEEGELKIELVYGNISLASVSQDIKVENASEESSNETINNTVTEQNETINETVVEETPGENLNLNFPKVIILEKNSNLTLGLERYFSNVTNYSVEQVENISLEILENNNLIILPDKDFVGFRESNLTINYENSSSVISFGINVTDFTENISNGTIRTLQYKAIINKPVKWVKTLKVEKEARISFELPLEAENIVVKTGEDAENSVSDAENSEGVVESADRKSILTGNVVLNFEKKQGLLTRFFNWAKKGITGNVISDLTLENITEINGSKIVDLSESNLENTTVAVEYDTEAPVSFETLMLNGKQIIVSAKDGLNYTDILAYTQLDGSSKKVGINEIGKIKLYWYASIQDAITYGYVSGAQGNVIGDLPNGTIIGDISNGSLENNSIIEIPVEIINNSQENLTVENSTSQVDVSKKQNKTAEKEKKKTKGITGNVIGDETLIEDMAQIVTEEKIKVEVNFTAYDLDADGFVDYVEWLVPHLSNQTYEIIFITKATELNSNKEFVRDVYDDVKSQDGNSTTIVSGNYLRVTFEKNLTNTKDITIYASGNNSSVEVYKENGNEVIAKFENISEAGWNKIYLTNLLNGESYDTFDLKSVGDVNYDYVVDPTGTLCYQESANTTNQTGVDGSCGLSYGGSYLCSGTWGSGYPCPNVSDGNWSTYGRASSPVAHTYLYINYTKPTGALNSSLWKVAGGSVPTVTNLSINSNCWNQNPLQFQGDGAGPIYTWRCWNGTQWFNLTNAASSNQLWEEAMWWNVSAGDTTYKISDLPPTMDVFDAESEAVNYSAIGQSGTKDSILKVDNVKVATININFSQNVNLSNVSANTSASLAKAFIHVPAGVSQVATNKTLYIPVKNNTGYVYVCPNASSFDQVNTSCTNFYSLAVSNVSGYYVVNVTGTGGGEYNQNITTCGILSVANTTYTLQNNLTTTGTCLNITASNITIIGQAYNITGDGGVADYGIYSGNNTNITIKNLSIISFGKGIYFNRTNNSWIETILSKLGIDGIFMDSSNNNTGYGVSILNNTGYGISLAIASGNNTFKYNTLNNQSVGVWINSTSGNNTFFNNNVTNASTKEFSDNTGDSYTNYFYYTNSFGTINWTNNSDNGFLKDMEVNGNITFIGTINISDNFVSINSSALTGKINSSANITLTGTPGVGLTNPTILKDGVACGSSCYNFTALNAAIVIFNVSSWSNYSIGEGIVSDTTAPSIQFVSPTPADASTQNTNSIYANVSASDAANISTFIDFNNSLVGWWRMDDVNQTGEGAKVIDYMNRNNGTANGNAVQNSSGKLGKSFSFDGNGDYISFGQNSLPSGNSSRTISVWFYYPNLPNTYNTLFAYGSASSSQAFGLTINLNKLLFFGYGDDITSVATLSPNNWYHVVGVYNGTHAMLYLNGTLDNSAAKSWNTVLNKAYIGEQINDASEYFQGSIDDVILLNRGLSADEIIGLYANTSSKYLQNNFTSLVDGSHTIKAYVQDLAGNVNSTELRTITVEATAPTYSNNVTNNTEISASTKFSILWNDNVALNPNGTYIFSTNNTGTWVNDSAINFTATPSWANVTKILNSTSGISIGYMWYAKDNIGNWNSTTIFILNTTDTTAPAISFVNPTPNNGTNQNLNSIYANVSASDASSISTFIDFNNSLVGWWRAEGNANDDLGYTNGTFAGGANASVTGKFGNAFGLDGTGDIITTPNTARMNTSTNITNLTLSVWIYPTYDTPSAMIILTKGDSSNGGYQLHWRGDYADGAIWFEIDNGANRYYYVSKDNLAPLNSWSHVVGVYNGTRLRIFVNGIEAGLSDYFGTRDVTTTITSTNSNFTIGGLSDYPSSYNFQGSIDDVMVFNRSLSVAEIVGLYANTSSKYLENNFTSLVDGSHTIKAYVQDLAGNVNSTETRTITTDTVTPLISFVSPTLANASRTDASFILANVSTSDLNNISTFINFNNSLVSWWRAEGNANDYLGRNNGALSGGALANGSGKFGNAFVFNGTKRTNTVYTNLAMPQGSGATISYWLYLSSSSSSPFGQAIMWSKPPIDTARPHWYMLERSGVLKTYNYYRDNSADIGSSNYYIFGSANAGTWNYIAVVQNTTNEIVYINGVNSGMGTFNMTGGETGNFTMSWDFWNNDGLQNSLNGSIDDVMIWDRSLSADEIIALYANTSSKYLYNSYSGLSAGNYTIQAYAQDTFGNINLTELRTIDVGSDTSNVTTCRNLSTANTVYTLQNNLTTTGTCIYITASNITLLGNGYNITGDTGVADYGVYSINNTNVTIQNISVISFGKAVYFLLTNNSLIQTVLTKLGIDGIFMDSSNNNTGYGVSILNNTGYGISLAIASGNNTFKYNTLNNQSVGVWFNSTSGNNTFFNNNVTNSSTSGFTDGTGNSYTNYFYYTNSFGTINWTNSSDNGFLKDMEVNGNITFIGTINISDNFVSINSSALTGKINSYANITLNGIGNRGFINATILKNGVPCGSACYNFTALNAATVIFNVSSWSNYSIGEADATPPFLTIVSPTNTVYSTNLVSFNVSANENLSFCKYSLNNWVSNTTMTALNTTYYYNLTTVADGSYTANFWCNDTTGNINNTESVSFVVSTNIAPNISFVNPTPSDASTQNTNSIYANVSSSDTNNISTFIDFNNSLVGWWRAEGDANDYLGRNNGTLTGNANATSTGKFGNAFGLDGNGDYVKTLTPSGANFTLTNSYTIHIWYKKETSSNFQYLFSKIKSTANYNGYQAYINQSGNIKFEMYGGGGGYIGRTTLANYNNNDWHQAVFVYSGNSASSGFSIYVDGIRVDNVNNAAGTLGSDSTNVGNFTIGAFGDGAGSYFNGSIDDVMVFNRSLSADEIIGLYANTSSKYLGNNFTSLVDGSHTIKAYVQDVNGVVNSTETRTITIDSTAPNISFVTPTPNNGTTQNINSIYTNVSSSDSANISTFIDFNNSLVGWWRAEGNANDYFGRNNGTLVGNANANSVGQFGNAFGLDGVGDKISITSFNTGTYKNWSMSAWVKCVGSCGVGGGSGTHAAILEGYSFQIITSDGRISSYDWTDYRTSTGAISYGSWQHVAIACYNVTNTMYFYINGQASGSSTYNCGVSRGVNALGCAEGGAAYNFNGSIDDVMVFNRSLSADEVIGLYANTSSKYIGNNFTSLVDGSHIIKAYVQDLAGNVNSTELRTVTIDSTAPTYSNNATNNTEISASTKFSILWNDNVALNPNGTYIFSTNNTGTWVNDSAINFTATPSWANVTKILNSTSGISIGYRWYAKDNIGNWNSTEIFILNTTDTTAPAILFVSPTPANASIQNINSIYTNVSSSDSANISTFIDFNNSLVGWWRAEGNANDYLGRNNGTLVGNANATATGKLGSAFGLDGNGDYVRVNTNGFGFSSVGNFTVSAWIKKPTRDYGIIFSDSWISSGFNPGWLFYVEGTAGKLKFYCSTGTFTASYLIGNAAVDDNVFHHVTVVYNNKNATFYIDGSSDQSGALTGSLGTASMSTESYGALTGANFDTSSSTFVNYFNGSIDDVILFNRSLSAAEIVGLYANTSSKYLENNFTSLVDGSHTIKAYVQDLAGNVNSTETRTITVDSTAPNISFISTTPDNASTTSNSSIPVNVSIVESNLSEVKYNWNGTNFTLYNDSLVLMMNLDNNSAIGENATRAVDVSKYGNNGTIVNAVWNSSGKYNGAMSFDGNEDYVAINSSSFNFGGLSGFTISSWINLRRFSSGGNPDYISTISRYGLDTSDGSYGLGVWGNSGADARKPSVNLKYGANYYTAYAASEITTDTWYHLLGTYNGTHIISYLNGNPGTPIALAGMTSKVGSNFYIGIAGDNPAPYRYAFNGSIDSFVVLNRTVSANEVKQMYYSNLQKYNSSQWYLYVNQSNLTDGVYTYQAYAKDVNNNLNLTEQRTIEVGSDTSNVTTCRNLSTANTVYTLQNNLTTTGTCIYITASNITLLGNGYNITGDTGVADYGVYSINNTNVTIQNLSIISFGKGIYFNATNNSWIEAILSKLGIDGIFMDSSNNNTGYGVSILNNTGYGISLAIASGNNTFKYNTLNNQSVGVWFNSTSGNNTFFNNNVTNSSTSGFTDGTGNSYTNYFYYTNSFGTINWTNNTDNGFLKDMEVNGNITFLGSINISHNFVSMNSSSLTGKINSSANITLTGTPGAGLTNPTILKDGVACGSACYNFTALNAAIVIFNVSSWSNYTIGEGNSAPNIPSVIINSTAGTNKTLENLNCYSTISDPEGNALNVSVRWYRNGTLNTTLDYSNNYANATLFVSTLNNGNTTKHENWSCDMRLYDGALYSNWSANSSNLTILNSAPTVSLSSPADQSSSTNRTQLFNWTGSDDDGDALNYTINLTKLDIPSNPGKACTDPERYITTAATSYSTFMNCFYDNGQYYVWKVAANDSEVLGAWTSSRNLTITALVAISLPVNETNFGSLSVFDINDTSDNSPAPLEVQNDGNCLSNVSIVSTALWDTFPGNSSYFKFKVDNKTGNEGAFNWLTSIIDWLQMPITGAIVGISDLNYSTSKNVAETDIYLEVPYNEVPGAKTAIINFTASLSE